MHSDHNSLITKLNMKYDSQKLERKTIFNFRDQTSMLNFKNKTSQSRIFQNIFESNLSFETKTAKWIKTLKRTISGCFKKVRLSVKGKKINMCKIFKKRKQAILANDEYSKNEAEELLGKEEATWTLF